MLKYFLTLIIASLCITGYTQQVIEVFIYDKEIEEPIIGAHIFLTNTNYGSISDEQGLRRYLSATFLTTSSY